MKRSKVNGKHNFLIFIKWLAIGLLTGAICGAIGAIFHHAIDHAAHFRAEHGWVYWLMPVVCVLVVGVYRLFRVDTATGMNDVIDAVKHGRRLPWGLGPSIFAGTVLSQFAGASTGREGAALQLGASVAGGLNKVFKLDESRKIPLLMCGMSAVFAAMFGTPVAAALFIVEFVTVGEMRYARLFPCVISALTAYWVSLLMGSVPVRYALAFVPEMHLVPILQVAVLGAVAAVMSIVFCVCVHGAHEFCHKTVKNDFIRGAAGAAVALILSLIVGVGRYNGAGMNLVDNAIAGTSLPWDFVLKLLFTAVCIGAGFKGGEIVPAFAVGASLGCTIGGLLGMDPGFAAAVCMIALFCGVVNCPIASIVIAVEIFGAEGLPFYALACIISYMLSGRYSLYGRQEFAAYTRPVENYMN